MISCSLHGEIKDICSRLNISRMKLSNIVFIITEEKEEAKKDESDDESDDDMGFGLFD